jgi:hypothetical protein
MKKCTYCGREYPDDVAVCLTDGQPLSGAETVSPDLAELSTTMVSTPAPLSQRRSFTNRQMEIIEVVLVCAIAFGISILASTYVFFGGAYSHNYNSFAWEMQGMREVLCLALLSRRPGGHF